MGDRRGFTLIETILALLILSLVMLALASATTFFVRVVGVSDRQTAAIALAEDRIETIRMDPDYQGLTARYAATESGFPGLPRFARRTEFLRVGGPADSVDYTKVTVTVTAPRVSAPVVRTITVAAP